MVYEMKKVAFIRVHNSRRSQVAEALGRRFVGDAFESYSAGTETKPQIDRDAVRLMREIYGIDMEAEGQRSKPVGDIPDGKGRRGVPQGHRRNRVAGKSTGECRARSCLTLRHGIARVYLKWSLALLQR